jgi:hypothetical protein
VNPQPTRLSRREFFAAVATIACGLWLGGLVMLLIAVTSLFDTFRADHATAGRAAAGLFLRFESLQILLAGIAIVGVEMSLRRGRRKLLIGVPLILAALVAIAIAFVITPKLDALHLAGETATDAFKSMHAAAMVAYLSILVLLSFGTAALAISMYAEIPPGVFGDPASPAAPADLPKAP